MDNMQDERLSDPYRILYIIAALTIVIAGMRYATNIIVPMLLAIFISIICSYPLNKMRLRGISKNLSILITVISVFIIAFLLTLILGTSIGDFSDNMPLYQSKLEELLINTGSKLQRFGIDFHYTEWRQYFDPGLAFGFAESLLKGLRSALTNAFLISLTVIFILLEIPVIDEEEIEKNLASPSNSQIIIQKIQHYFGIKTMTSLVTGVAITIWLLIIGVDYPRGRLPCVMGADCLPVKFCPQYWLDHRCYPCGTFGPAYEWHIDRNVNYCRLCCRQYYHWQCR